MPSDKLYPGLCDFHVHVGERIAGYQLRDGFRELDSLAATQGLRAVGAFVTEEEGTPLKDKLRRMQNDAATNFRGHVQWHLTPVYSSPEEVASLLREGCDLKFYTTYKSAGLHSSYQRIERWMRELSGLKPRLLVHCEDDDAITQASADHPFRTPFDHTLRRPESAEVIAVERLLDLAVKHEHPLHVVHVSAPRSALLIRSAQAHNPAITCETAPHYLLRNEDTLRGNNAHRWICTPPFRSENSRGQLVELLQDGYFDILASDHCAFTNADKDRFRDTPEQVPCGIPGVESLFPSCYSALVNTGLISLDRLVELACVRPAQLMGIANEPVYPLSSLLGRKGQPYEQ